MTNSFSPLSSFSHRGASFSTRADAVRDARVHIWGTAHIAKREFVELDDAVVTADINGHLVVLFFDNYGRLDSVRYL